MLTQVDTQLLDESRIEALRALGGDDDPDFLSDIIADYTADAAVRIAEVKRYLAAGDAGRASAAAHALKGASYNVGAHQLGDLAKRFEETCIEGDPADLHSLVREMEKAFRRTSQAILVLR